ncbi:MAG TPA: glycosyltransferase, partial [Candidatus Limnocylindrales bacterium]
MDLRVLVVARWYPSFDQPERGSFVADHVAAIAAAGARPLVASFERVPMRGEPSARAAAESEAAGLFGSAIERGVDGGWAVSVPRAWGAPGVPVARLPVVVDPERREPLEAVEAHARALLPFGLAVGRSLGIDLVHAHTGLPDGLAAARLAERLAVPLITTEHSSTIAAELADETALRSYRTLLEAPRQLVAVSATLATDVAGRLGVDPSAIKRLPNAVPVERFPPGPSSGRDPDQLLYVAARRATKGIELLLRAYAAASRQRPRLRLRIVGPAGLPDDERRWQELLDELEIRPGVSLDDRLDRQAVGDAMRRAAVFVHPSPRETFGMVAAEAMASGLPVAATRSGGVEAIVGDDGLGELAEGQDPAALAAAILRLLDRRTSLDPEVLHRSIADRFGGPAIAGRTFELYEAGLTAARRARGSPVSPSAPRSRARTVPAASPPVVIVGLARELAIQRLQGLPVELQSGLVVATRGRTGLADPHPLAGEWLQVDPDAEYHRRQAALGVRGRRGSPVRRLARIVRSPVRAWRRRRLADGNAARRLILAEHLLAAAERAATSHPLTGGGPRVVLAVPIEAGDVLAIGPLLGRAVRPSPARSIV